MYSILRKPAGRRLAEVLFANEVRNGGVGGGRASGAQNWHAGGDGGESEDLDFGRFWKLLGWRMVGPCWTQVGVAGVDAGPVVDPCWRLLGRLGVHVGVCWGDLGARSASYGAKGGLY